MTAFVEVSPHPVLVPGIEATLAELDLAAAEGAVVAGSLRRGEGGLGRFGLSLARLWVRGVGVDWARWFGGPAARAVELPTYAFVHERFWPRPGRWGRGMRRGWAWWRRVSAAGCGGGAGGGSGGGADGVAVGGGAAVAG